mmetsp:Transcript_32652/g.86216  ORF Transcript_32652/g.86216 Transcript_32652/m.86216 type:complete len:236 (+) Transcript_32652:1914-2621(+)
MDQVSAEHPTSRVGGGAARTCLSLSCRLIVCACRSTYLSEDSRSAQSALYFSLAALILSMSLNSLATQIDGMCSRVSVADSLRENVMGTTRSSFFIPGGSGGSSSSWWWPWSSLALELVCDSGWSLSPPPRLALLLFWVSLPELAFGCSGASLSVSSPAVEPRGGRPASPPPERLMASLEDEPPSAPDMRSSVCWLCFISGCGVMFLPFRITWIAAPPEFVPDAPPVTLRLEDEL